MTDTSMPTIPAIHGSPAESTVMQMLGDWLKNTALPTGWTLRQAQQNRLPAPPGPLMLMQLVARRALGTNRHCHGPDSLTITQPVELDLQLTAYGTDAVSVLGTIGMVWRDEAAVRWFLQRRTDMAPASSEAVTQHRFTNAEQQYEDSATLVLHLAIQASLHQKAETATALHMASMTPADSPALSLATLSPSP